MGKASKRVRYRTRNSCALAARRAFGYVITRVRVKEVSASACACACACMRARVRACVRACVRPCACVRLLPWREDLCDRQPYVSAQLLLACLWRERRGDFGAKGAKTLARKARRLWRERRRDIFAGKSEKAGLLQ
eukprot:1991659-Pleurochrysis_carterae.AAC.1